MLKIGRVTESDRDDWEVLCRAFHTHFGTSVADERYERTWQLLLDGVRIRGIAAKLAGRNVGVAHYLFHGSVWGDGRCYLADLFVDPTVRRQGVATALLKWVASDAARHGAPRMYWNTLSNAPARGLYDKVATCNDGLIVYTYRRDVDEADRRGAGAR